MLITLILISRWIDFENDYKTLNLSFMESVWWVFAECWKKRVRVNGEDRPLIYRDFKVMPYSTGCTTPLSNFEAGLNYKDVPDPASAKEEITPRSWSLHADEWFFFFFFFLIIQLLFRSHWSMIRIRIFWRGPPPHGPSPPTWHSVSIPTLNTSLSSVSENKQTKK